MTCLSYRIMDLVNSYNKDILVKDYFDIHNFYSNIYGTDRTIILMQVGSFHECYATDEDGIDLQKLSQHLDIVCTKKNNSSPLSKSNPRMMGFPLYTTLNYIDKLIDINYTVVLIDQVTEPPNPKRAVTGIYSPATHINSKSNKSLYLVSIVLDKIKDRNGLYQVCVGLSAYDLSTGIGSIYETFSKSDDTLIGLDDALRFLENYPPREIILENNLDNSELISNMKVNDILAYLNIDINKIYKVNSVNSKKLSYQKKIFEEIFKISSNIDILEHLCLVHLSWARISLTLLLEYSKQHQPVLLDNLQIPKLFSSEKYLYLGNKALDQLDILTKTNSDSTNLFNVINYTKTATGKRYLNQQLIMPLIDPCELINRYNTIETLLSGSHQNKIIDWLDDIYDLDKLIRKLEINIINPYELYNLYISFYQINKLSNYLTKNNLLSLFSINKEHVDANIKLITFIEKNFKTDKINGLNFNNFTSTEYSFYNNDTLEGRYKDIDNIQEQINSTKDFMNNLVSTLEKIMDPSIDKSPKGRVSGVSLITLKSNDRDGYYLLITNKRCDILKKNLPKKFKVGSIELKDTDLEFNPLPKSANTKINCSKIKELSNSLNILTSKLAIMLKEYFKVDMLKLYNDFKDVLHIWTNKIGYIDFINSGALCAIDNHYSKPIIKQSVNSYFKGIDMRHPIIEKINTTINYVPHTLELGTDEQNGILLYGINSSGKSTLMKSIGLNIILAQIGYYTATKSFEFSPYKTLFTRISGNDNMFKGLSSFMVEMMELIAILKRNDKNTLVIADEICRGTEILSASTIVCYMLEKLSKSNTSFITATHLHNIAHLETITNLKSLKSKHLKLTYDPTNDMLVYDRTLSDGHGESFYGLQVAKYLMKDKHFNERTLEILNEYNSIDNPKQSKYNNNIYMDGCQICKVKNKLETHHIVWQKNFDNNDVNKNQLHLHKNNESNLVTLCMTCHDKVDRNEIVINGWIETSLGRKFEYKLNENPIINSKYDDETIKYIKKLKIKYNGDAKMARIKIKEKLDRKISTKTILKFWE